MAAIRDQKLAFELAKFLPSLADAVLFEDGNSSLDLSQLIDYKT